MYEIELLIKSLEHKHLFEMDAKFLLIVNEKNIGPNLLYSVLPGMVIIFIDDPDLSDARRTKAQSVYPACFSSELELGDPQFTSHATLYRLENMGKSVSELVKHGVIPDPDYNRRQAIKAIYRDCLSSTRSTSQASSSTKSDDGKSNYFENASAADLTIASSSGIILERNKYTLHTGPNGETIQINESDYTQK